VKARGKTRHFGWSQFVTSQNRWVASALIGRPFSEWFLLRAERGRKDHSGLGWTRVRVREHAIDQVAAIEQGNASAAILSAINAREAEIAAIDARLSTLSEPVEPRMAVVLTWVRQQLEDAAGILGEVPERAKPNFSGSASASRYIR
jgi:hypothetical protein